MILKEMIFFIIFVLPSMMCIWYTIVKDRKDYKKFFNKN